MHKISFESSLYSGEAVKRALYKMSDRFTADIRQEGAALVCDIHFPASKSEEAKVLDLANFRKEVLDEDLREKIRVETEPVRNLILAHAFSRTGLISQ